MSGPPPHVIYEFGDFRLDASRRLLFARGGSDPLPIKPKVLEAILYFIEHPGELLEKDRLMANLWPGLVVEENNLTQLISTVRRILGESRGENRYLATVPGRGYRFVADVVRLSDATEAQPAPPSIAPGSSLSSTPSRRQGLLAPVVLAFSLGAAVYAYGTYAGWWPAPKAESSAVATELPARTVAVLAFENLSEDEDNEHLASGVAESVLHRLAGIRGLTLIARTSSFAFHDKTTDAREIGRALNARYLVEGSLQRSGDRLRVTAQLIDASTGGHVWSLRLDRTIDDIFAVEDEIARSVAEALEVSFNEAEHPYAHFGIEAYLAFLDGRALVQNRKVADAERAIERFSRAIEIAPDFAAGYAALADAHVHLALLLRGSPEAAPLLVPEHRADLMEAAARKAEPLLATALQLDDALGEAYVLRADLKAFAGDVAGAEADYRKGLALRPSFGAGHQHFATFLLLSGRSEEAHAEIDKATLVDPINPRNVYSKGTMYLLSEETGTIGEQSETYFRKALQIAPDYHPALARIGAIRWHQGRFAEAIQLAEQALLIDPRANWIRSFLVEFYLELGDADAARSVLAEQPDSPRPSQWLAICLYEQKVDRAVELLRADPYGRGFLDHDVEAYVLRDAALAKGDLAHGRRELRALPSRLGIPIEDDPFRIVALAHVNLALGDRRESERLARLAVALEAYRLAYPRAAALTLLGQNEAALELLEDSFARGYRKRWWYAFERDPGFEALHSDPRFQTLAGQARAHANAERVLLEQMRERGDIPARTLQRSPAGGLQAPPRQDCLSIGQPLLGAVPDDSDGTERVPEIDQDRRLRLRNADQKHDVLRFIRATRRQLNVAVEHRVSPYTQSDSIGVHELGNTGFSVVANQCPFHHGNQARCPEVRERRVACQHQASHRETQPALIEIHCGAARGDRPRSRGSFDAVQTRVTRQAARSPAHDAPRYDNSHDSIPYDSGAMLVAVGLDGSRDKTQSQDCCQDVRPQRKSQEFHHDHLVVRNGLEHGLQDSSTGGRHAESSAANV